jgi:hypothetical protein
MSYRWPFDQPQSEIAKREYSKMRSNLRAWLKKSVPKKPDEKFLFAGCQMCVQIFGQELLKPFDSVNTDLLNRTQIKARSFFYLFVRPGNR